MINYFTYYAGKNHDVVVMEIPGHADAGSSDFLVDWIQGIIEDGRQHIVRDCSGLDVITSM